MIAYRPPRWLPGGHAQTIYPLLIKPDAPIFRRERLNTRDHDFIDLDWLVRPRPSQAHSPLLVLFHGLEGNSNSHYARSMMQAISAQDWEGVVVHFRGCSGEPNRLPRAYHSGDSEEIDWILRHLKQHYPGRTLHAVGVSLGGNALLKWLGEQGNAAQAILAAAAAVSTPFDLTISGHHLGRGFNRLYTQHFLHTLKAKAADKLQRFPGLFDLQQMRKARTLHEFDDIVTAPLHGFASADDYWRRASSKPWLHDIHVPTLLLNARNDPFFPAQALPAPSEIASIVRSDFPEEGGHVGFVSDRLPGRLDWMPQRVLCFLKNGE